MVYVPHLVRSLWRNPAGPLLVALQVAAAMIVLVNASYAIFDRWKAITRPTGMDLQNIVSVATEGYGTDYKHASAVRADLAFFNSLPSVVAASMTFPVPQSSGGLILRYSGSSSPSDEKRFVTAYVFHMTQDAVQALGLKLIHGRGFSAQSVLPPGSAGDFEALVGTSPVEAIVTKALADRLYPNENALGKTIVAEPQGTAIPIVGIVERMQATPPIGKIPVSRDGSLLLELVVVLPVTPAGPNGYFAVRAHEGRVRELLRAIEKDFAGRQNSRFVLRTETLGQVAARTRRPALTEATVLLAVTMSVLLVTAVGIFGLSAHNVTFRTRQIGMRRAVGARRRDIVRYFIVENWMITTAGVLAGIPLALLASRQLSGMFSLPPPSWSYYVAAALWIWIVGSIATLIPARRASAIPPAVATRAT